MVFWVDILGRRLQEDPSSVPGKVTKLRAPGNNIYTCVVRLIGVIDIAPVTFGVYHVQGPLPLVTTAYMAMPQGSIACPGGQTASCVMKQRKV